MLDRLTTTLRLRSLDARDRLGGRADRLVPPRRLHAARSDFVLDGEEMAHYLAEHAGLRPGDALLELGCGAGALARALAGYLGPGGSYDGLDADRAAIGWCRRRYRRRPGFRFQVADVFDARRNPAGRHLPSEYRFPYEDARFDVVAAAGVFTNLLPEEAEHHVSEIARVLKPGGRMLATFFLLNDTSRALVAEGRAGLPFADAEEPVAVVDDGAPDEAVAYAEDWLFEALHRHRLTLTQVHPGSWCAREEYVSFQDVVVAEREGVAA